MVCCKVDNLQMSTVSMWMEGICT